MAIKVLVIDDSALMRLLLTEIINGAPDLGVVGSAPASVPLRPEVPFPALSARLLSEKIIAIGMILTGMGKDGAQGLLQMREAGAWTIGQNQESCVVYGMPREAALLGAVDEVVALTDVADRIMSRLRAMDRQLQRG